MTEPIESPVPDQPLHINSECQCDSCMMWGEFDESHEKEPCENTMRHPPHIQIILAEIAKERERDPRFQGIQ